MLNTVEPMARKSASARNAPPPPPEEPLRKNVISIRGTEAWRTWLGEYAAKRRVPVTSLIDQVLAEAAERDGFKAPPER